MLRSLVGSEMCIRDSYKSDEVNGSCNCRAAFTFVKKLPYDCSFEPTTIYWGCMLQALTQFIVDMSSKLVGTIESGNYGLIVLLIAIESSFIPFPSEIVMIPAGILVFQGKMSFTWAVVAGIVGSILGSLFNYYLAVYAGRPIIAKYGKYFLIDEKKLKYAEDYFEKHGHITTFICRLIPGVRQIISFPAGLCRMNIYLFCLYTTLGCLLYTSPSPRDS